MAKISITDNSTSTRYFDHLATNGADTVEMSGQDNIINTKKGKDRITIKKGKGEGTDLIAKGGKDNDTIIIQKNTDNCEAWGEDGKDTITINAGKYHEAYGGAGADKINVNGTGGFYNTADGGVGNDTITVTGGNAHQIYGGKGDDKIYINKGAGESIHIDGGFGADTITINDGTGCFVYGGEGTGKKNIDKIYVKGGKDHVIAASPANDEIYIQGGSGVRFTSDSGTNTIKVTGGNNHIINSPDTGSDKTTKDIITIEGKKTSGVDVYCQNGKDTITINGGKNCTIHSYDDKDTIRITGGTKNTVTSYGDAITVSGGASTVKMCHGAGSVNLTGGTCKLNLMYIQDIKFTVTAKNGTVSGNRLYVDTTDYTFKNWKLKQTGNDLKIADYSGNVGLTIKGFFSNGAFSNGIQLTDTRWDFEKVKAEANK